MKTSFLVDDKTWSIIQMFEEKLCDTGEKLENPLNCPLLTLSKILIVIPTT